jgi:hypothetical protein
MLQKKISRSQLFKDNVEINEALHTCMDKNMELYLLQDKATEDIKEVNAKLVGYNASIDYLNKQISIYEAKQIMWYKVASDKQALLDKGKTEEQALNLASYFEGIIDGLILAKRYIKNVK